MNRRNRPPHPRREESGQATTDGDRLGRAGRTSSLGSTTRPGSSSPAPHSTPTTRPFDEHPGAVNYPPDRSADGYPAEATRRNSRQSGRTGTGRGPADQAYLPPPTHNPHLSPLHHRQSHARPGEEPTDPIAPGQQPNGPSTKPTASPSKLTVTRVAAMRGKYFSKMLADKVYQAATADGADRSGMTALTIPVITNFAVDAAMAVALANTLFFAAATGESKVSVALYLALTIAPFAVIAPLIGPVLDRLQRGRRIAMATTFGLRSLLAILIITNSDWNSASGQLHYDPWVLYPCALGLMVLSKSFGVLKSAVTPRVVPPAIDLPRVNSRLTTFGLIFGTIAGGAVAAVFEMLLSKLLPLHLPGALVWLCILGVAGAVYCMRIPAWVESTEGEVPTTFSYHGEPATSPPPRDDARFTHGAEGTGAGAGTMSARGRQMAGAIAQTIRQPLGRVVVAGLWGNATIRVLTGFLTLYIAFYAKAQGEQSGLMQLAAVGAVGAAAGVGNALGNGLGTRVELRNPPRIIVIATSSCCAIALLAALFGNLFGAVAAGLVASGMSAIGKVCLDSTIQDGLPEQSRASAFGRSETVLQFGWVLGAALGVLLPTTLSIGFGVVAGVMAIGTVQTILTTRGSTLVPGFGGNRPDYASATGAIHRPEGAPGTHPQGPRAAPTDRMPPGDRTPSTDRMSPTDRARPSTHRTHPTGRRGKPRT
ncbi:MFS transporter [Gordonia amarae]|uniref:Major facilitator superfamily transporter n=2 Tax=Gordonia amarae TaxID=36821 RepID=G7GS67_9ACTN|nr:MFS transporter [Gordonia amarae]MCS3877893.1 MFS family permease [Gordonia amarae]QHN16609.1 MFS transporter [Gordonia amarae]QHN21134.1 MFS transporter [Gordonia amarae]QHN29987.1 MFS transporter [Gordonia amarae]QHN38762.1 MFS transporter [Gordonia amarae]